MLILVPWTTECPFYEGALTSHGLLAPPEQDPVKAIFTSREFVQVALCLLSIVRKQCNMPYLVLKRTFLSAVVSLPILYSYW